MPAAQPSGRNQQHLDNLTDIDFNNRQVDMLSFSSQGGAGAGGY